MDRELSKRVPGLVRNVTFHNPIILSAEDTVIKVEVRDHGDGRVEYTFYEAGVEDGSGRRPTGSMLPGSKSTGTNQRLWKRASTRFQSKPSKRSLMP